MSQSEGIVGGFFASWSMKPLTSAMCVSSILISNSTIRGSVRLWKPIKCSPRPIRCGSTSSSVPQAVLVCGRGRGRGLRRGRCHEIRRRINQWLSLRLGWSECDVILNQPAKNTEFDELTCSYSKRRIGGRSIKVSSTTYITAQTEAYPELIAFSVAMPSGLS